MRGLGIARPGDRLSVLCLGAHSDDIEIGAGGTLLTWMAAGMELDVHWCVFSAAGVRGKEARSSACAMLSGAARSTIELGLFEDGYFPQQSREIKRRIEAIRKQVDPDVILTHRREDAHQDHREISKLTSNVFRDHLILEYEIPKWDGDLCQPGVYVPLAANTLERKIAIIHEKFQSQRSKDWFDEETFRGLARIRGMECRAPDRYAEAFVVRKAVLTSVFEGKEGQLAKV